MHKRNKKNKQKHPNPTPHQKKEEPKNVQDVQEGEGEDKFETKVVSEIIENTQTVELKDELMSDKIVKLEEKTIEETALTPTKPKRNKSSKNKLNIEEHDGEKCNKQINMVDDKEEQTYMIQGLTQVESKCDDKSVEMKLDDMTDKEDVNKKQENITPAARKKKGKQYKSELCTDETVKITDDKERQNVMPQVLENTAQILAPEIEEIFYSGAECIDVTSSNIEQKSSQKRKNKRNQKTSIEPTTGSEKTSKSQTEDVSTKEETEIKHEEGKDYTSRDKHIKSKQKSKAKSNLYMKEEKFVTKSDEEISQSVFKSEIQECKTEIKACENKELKKEEPPAKPHKNKANIKIKKAGFKDVKDGNKHENYEESVRLRNEITGEDVTYPTYEELEITEFEANKDNESNKLDIKSEPEHDDQTKITEAVLCNIDTMVPTNKSLTQGAELCNVTNELQKDFGIYTEQSLESFYPGNLTRLDLTSESLPTLSENDNNNINEENPILVDQVVNNEFEKLLVDRPDTLLIIEESNQSKVLNDKADNIDTVYYRPLSEQNIDESCKKLFETLLVEDSADFKSTKLTKRLTKEEQFIIGLFGKADDVRKESESQAIKQSKPETTDLKEKVLEVNKDMEDLKLSIEKSLAELTYMESQEIPEIVSIVDYEPTSPFKTDIKEMEAMPTGNTETTTNISENTQPLTPTSVKAEKNIKELETAYPIQGETKDTHTKKNKGKGKCSKTFEENPQNIQVKTEDITKNFTHVKITEVEELPKEEYQPNLDFFPNTDTDTTKNLYQCSTPEPKGKEKGKNNKNKNKGETTTTLQSTNQTSVQNTNQAQQTSNNQEYKDNTKESETAAESKECEQKKSKTVRSTEQDNPYQKSECGQINRSESDYNETFSDQMNSSIEEDALFETTSASNPSSESPPSFVVKIEKDIISADSEEPNETKQPDENQVENPIDTRSKNLLGSPNISVTSSKIDYKKEKNKNVTPNSKKARIKVKDSVEIENKMKKCSKHSQTENKLKKRSMKSASPESEDEEFVYQYSFRKVFLTNCCNTCNSELKGKRFSCGHCNLIFYCSQKHKDEDWPQHHALCFAVSTLVHLKGLKFIYGDAAGCKGQDYRLLRMQVIVSCEKILKRKLLPCEQEALLYPRMCAEPKCREWKSANLKDCEGCGLASYCASNPEHITKEHQLWCKSYRLYHKLVTHQQIQGRIEPRMPSKVITEPGFRIPNKMNELLALVYEEKIDMDDVHYAALTQLATAPLTAAYSYQLYKDSFADLELQNGYQGKTFVLHVVGAELQFEADTLNKWEVFFLHTRPDIQELRIVFVGPELNPSKLPLGLLAKIKMCKQCRNENRKILFDYQDGQLYHIYVSSRQFVVPEIVCAFNPGLHRKTGFGSLDTWPQTINSIIKLKVPFCVTSYTKFELPQDIARIEECSEHEYKIILEPALNPFASIRPDRNFISDNEMPLIFKNYCVSVLCGV